MLLAGLGGGACSSPTERPPTYHPPSRDAGPLADADTSLPPEDPGPPLPEPDLAFTLPYGGPSQDTDLEFTVGVQRLDVHFSIDTTGSFLGEIKELQESLIDVVLPGIREGVADATVGVSRFEDFPVEPYGSIDDRPFRLLLAQSTDSGSIAHAVERLVPLGDGFDEPEASPEALYQIATGDGLRLLGAEIVEPFDRRDGVVGTRGGAGFREGALPVIIQVTDARPHDDNEYEAPIDAHSRSEVEHALHDLGARVVGIASGDGARPYLEEMATETGAVADPVARGCSTGTGGAVRPPNRNGVCPLVYDIEPSGAGLSETIVDALQDLLASIVFERVSIVILDDELGFVLRAVPVDAVTPEGIAPPELADLLPEDGADGVLDSFTKVRSGTRLRFRLTLANDAVRETDYEQIFFLRARIVADDDTVLDERLVEVRVPARTPPTRDLDAGVDAGLDAGGEDAGDAAQ